MKKLFFVVALAAMVGLAPSAFAAQVEVHGTLDNQLGIYDDQANFFKGDSTGSLDRTTDQFAAIKYRIRTEIGTDDNAIKGVFGIEVGADRFGSSSSSAPQYSGDKTSDIELRFAYTDFMLGPGHLKFGLAPWKVNRYVWTETAPSIQWGANLGSVDLNLGWARGNEYQNTSSADAFNEDQDALMARATFGIGQGSNVGVFALWQVSNPSQVTADGPVGQDAGKFNPAEIDSNDWYYKLFNEVDSNMWTVGVDGKMTTSGPLFIAWDLAYQNGEIQNIRFTDLVSGTTNTAVSDYDLSAYFAHVDVGLKLGKTTLTYTGWYASGDNNPNDGDFDAFLATDVDMNASIIFFEGGYTNDVYFTDRPYVYDKGMFFNRLGCDFQVNDKTTIGGAAIYAQTAEDMEYTDNGGVARSSSDLGIELDAYVSYKMYKNLTLALNAGYLFAGDAMDFFEVGAAQNGSSDENIFRTTAHAVYSF